MCVLSVCVSVCLVCVLLCVFYVCAVFCLRGFAVYRHTHLLGYTYCGKGVIDTRQNTGRQTHFRPHFCS